MLRVSSTQAVLRALKRAQRAHAQVIPEETFRQVEPIRPAQPARSPLFLTERRFEEELRNYDILALPKYR